MGESAAIVELASDGQCLEHARALVAALEEGDGARALESIDALTTLRETALYRELGQLTRELHDLLNAFYDDPKFSALAVHEIPTTRERLLHVIALTQDAADRTLTAVEGCAPLAKDVSERAERLGERWQRFCERKLTVEEFRQLSGDVSKYLAHTAAAAESLHAGLSDVVVAQEYQDLTGQIIKRVVTLVDDVEQRLVAFVTMAARHVNPGDEPVMERGATSRAKPGSELVSGQDEVDDLLSSLGF